jgi:hypothetical protein
MRWTVKVYYRHPDTPEDTYQIEELSELQALIEGGPDWRLIEEISITYNAR